MYRREAGGTPIFPRDFLRHAVIVPLKLKFGKMIFLKAQKRKEMIFLLKNSNFWTKNEQKKCLEIFKSFHCLDLAILGQYPKDVVLRRDMPPHPNLIFLNIKLKGND